MSVAAHHVLLGLAVAALGAAAVRLVSRAAPDGPERLVAAVPLAAAAAVTEALALGLLELGGSTAALAGAAALTWLAVRALTPDPARPVRSEAADAWRALPVEGRAAAGALAGLGVVVAAHQVARPVVGYDGLIYHGPEVLAWVRSGRVGEVVPLIYDLPVGAYPLTNEALLAWGTAIGRSFVPMALWTPATLALLVLAGWAGLRRLAVPPALRALAVAGLALVPVLVGQLGGPNTDLPALAWLTCAAALVAARRPALLAPAVVAAALAVGTKTTTAPLALAVLAFGVWDARRALRPLAAPLLWALALGTAAGGVWYLRNLGQHGSPLWPFISGPLGDPRPPLLDDLRFSLLSRPRATVAGFTRPYAEAFGGGLVMIAAALVAPLVVRRRAQALAGAIALAALVVWAAAPVTGRSDIAALGDLPVSTVRYALPALAAAAAAVALAGRSPRPGVRRAVAGALALAVAIDVLVLAGVDAPEVPAPAALAGGALAGAAVGALARRRPRGPVGASTARSPAAGPALAVVLGAVAALGAPGFVARHAALGLTWDAAAVGWLDGRSGFGDGDAPVAGAPLVSSMFAGDRLRHPTPLVGVREPCPAVRDRARRGWVVVELLRTTTIDRHPRRLFPVPGAAARCLAPERPAFRGGAVRVYEGRR